jgi:hypothetical protein
MLSRSQLFRRLALAVTALPCAICAIGIISVIPGCSAQEEVSITDNPIAASETDDTAPAELPFDQSLSYTNRRGGTENHSTDRYRFDVAAYADDAEQAMGTKLYPSHAAFLESLGKGSLAIPSVQTIGTYVIYRSTARRLATMRLQW